MDHFSGSMKNYEDFDNVERIKCANFLVFTIIIWYHFSIDNLGLRN
jgi:hypothetical protein